MKPANMKPSLSPASGPQPLAPARRALASLALSTLLASLGASVTAVGLPVLAQAFDASFQHVQWVVLAGFISFKYREPEPLAAFQDTVGRP